MPNGFIILPALSVYLGTSQSTIREWIRTRGFPFYKPGKVLLFKIVEVDQWMLKFKHKTVNLTGGK